MRTREALYVELANRDLRWEMRRAAVDRRITVRALVSEILADWLRDKHRSGKEEH
jgi:DNA-binding transcriptional ArsR family regulator